MPEKLFDVLRRAFDQAAALTGIETFKVEAGRLRIGIEMAGAHLVELFAGALWPIAPLPADAPQLRVRVFDSTVGGPSMPPPPWGPHDYGPRGEIAGFNDERFATTYRIEAGVLTMADRRRGEVVVWIRDTAHYPSWMRAAPLRTVLHWLGRDRGLHLVHGAAVARQGEAVVLTARGGSGKSTTAVRAALDGLEFLGDDYVLVEPVGDSVHSAYRTAKLSPDTVDRFAPSLRQHVVGEVEESGKWVVRCDRAFPDRMARHASIRAIAIPDIERPAGVTVATHADAMIALAPTTVFQLAGSSSEDVEVLQQWVRRFPVFWLGLDGAGGAGPLIEAVLDAAAGVTP